MDIGFAAAFLGGVAALLSPCSAMLLPSFFAMAFGSRLTSLLGRVGLFYLGSVTVLVPMGLAAGSFGHLVSAHRTTLSFIGGFILVAIGLAVIFGLSIPLPGLRAKGGSSPIAVFILGAVYGLAGACTGPLLGAILTVAAISSSALYGAILLALFAAGMTVPLAILAMLWDKVNLVARLRPRPIEFGPVKTTLWGVFSGALFVALGLLFVFTDATGSLGGILDAKAQYGIELRLWRIGANVPDYIALIVVALLVGGLAFWALRRADN